MKMIELNDAEVQKLAYDTIARQAMQIELTAQRGEDLLEKNKRLEAELDERRDFDLDRDLSAVSRTHSEVVAAVLGPNGGGTYQAALEEIGHIRAELEELRTENERLRSAGSVDATRASIAENLRALAVEYKGAVRGGVRRAAEAIEQRRA